MCGATRSLAMCEMCEPQGASERKIKKKSNTFRDRNERDGVTTPPVALEKNICAREDMLINWCRRDLLLGVMRSPASWGFAIQRRRGDQRSSCFLSNAASRNALRARIVTPGPPENAYVIYDCFLVVMSRVFGKILPFGVFWLFICVRHSMDPVRCGANADCRTFSRWQRFLIKMFGRRAAGVLDVSLILNQ